ncbi:MAG: spore germination protein [Lachnospiraceae bacterium]|nr:spore germination protein [Lachnospiraceae bacterium]
MKLSRHLEENKKQARAVFPIGKSFDLITRDLRLGNTKAWLLAVNGMCRTDVLQEIFSDLQNPVFMANADIQDLSRYLSSKIGYAQAQLENDWDEIVTALMSGPSVLFVDGFADAIILDTRTYPARGISEPDTERVTLGSRDGFVETMLFNANLIRRRIRNPRLTFDVRRIGTDSRTDIAVAYIDGYVDPVLLEKVLERLETIKATSLTMGAKSLEELLVPKRWYHPLPSIQQTQRPDVACSYLTEGNLLLLVDNSPSVLILPSTIFQFTQSPEDYYKSPLVGSYSRLLRFCCIFISLFLLPVFLLIGSYYPETVISRTLFPVQRLGPIRLFWYVLFAELALDLFQYSASHSPSSYSGSLSIVGGLILSDAAIDLHWVSLEVMFYAAATLLSSLALSSTAFSEGIRFYRIFLLLMTGFFGRFGFAAGCLLVLLSILTTPSFAGKSFFWPLYPFNKKALSTLLLRRPTYKAQPDNIWKRERKKTDQKP